MLGMHACTLPECDKETVFSCVNVYMYFKVWLHLNKACLNKIQFTKNATFPSHALQACLSCHSYSH